jgi:hypothetical protein
MVTVIAAILGAAAVIAAALAAKAPVPVRIKRKR